MEWLVLLGIWKFLVWDDLEEQDVDSLLGEVLAVWRRWMGW